jgi:hypothetical protein
LTEISTNAVNQFQAASLAGVAEQTLLSSLGLLNGPKMMKGEKHE